MFGQSIRMAARSLRRRPGFSALASMTMALGAASVNPADSLRGV